MKTLFSSLLLGAIAVLSAPEASAQHVVGSTYPSGRYSSGYVSSRVWVAGRYEMVSERVFVPGPTRQVWVDPVYAWRLGPCGMRYVCVSAGYWKTVQLPGRYENRWVRVYRPGHWVARGSCN